MAESSPLFYLPPELLIRVLSFLPALTDIHACRRTSRFFLHFINSSIELQYLMATFTAQVTDNPYSTAPISERIRALSARERTFGEGTPSWSSSIPVTFQPSGLYELSAGLFFLGEQQRQALRYIELPTVPIEEDAPPQEWCRLAISPQSVIIDFGLAIEEHDLIVIATFTPTSPRGREGLVNLEFRSMSTHLPHPQARGPIEVYKSDYGLPNITLETVGEHAVLAVMYPHAGRDTGPEDHVYVYEWKTGKLKMKIDADWRTYFGAVFLSPDVLMLPNTKAATLELWRIPSEQTTAPTLTLHLPRLLPDVRIGIMTARGEPNPLLSSARKSARLPFYPSVDDSIMVFHVSFPVQKFLLYIHRRALLALLDTHAAGDACNYADWGPDACRWLNAVGINTDWITTTSGQRGVLLPVQGPTLFFLLDFNTYKTRMPGTRCIPPEDDPFMDYGIWAEAVGSRLPCHAVRSEGPFGAYSGVSLDDERVIALRRNLLRQVSAVDIFYFG
ncbi:hypothetical protein C8R44DRAFT_810237 [Mycena epipterygia]|nr:hypothetical protein C8R44DRAFT_810237 [Mycena epipterygia]